MRRPIAVILLLSAFVPATALASGFELRESSAHAMATSYAGAAASNSDAGFLFYNPASLGGVDTWDMSLNATGLILGTSGNFTGTTAAGTPAGGLSNPSGFLSNALVPAGDIRYRINDQFAVGVSLSSPWGESTKYPAGWTGRYYAMTTRLTSVDITPLISYQPVPEFTFAAGPQIQYLNAELSEAIDFGTLGALNGFPGAVPGDSDGAVQLHGNSWAAGYTLGAMWEMMPNLSLGASYRSTIHQALQGTEDFTYDSAGIGATINALTGAFADGKGRTSLPTPAVVMGGAHWALDDRWTALAEVEYTNWSSLKQLLIVPDNPLNPTGLTVLDWKNTWFGSFGGEYRYDEQWTLRLGGAYDEAAAPSETVEPRIPDANRYWLSGGIGYRWRPGTDVNFAVAHLFTPHSDIDQLATGPGNATRGSLMGISNSDATLISLQLVMREPFAL
ncbi:MAG TPA: outer membrane protein transport protein [Rhizomicrobium sp.]|nr:outer membrane protein transport protein [Rhizomicrobium sp.]